MNEWNVCELNMSSAVWLINSYDAKQNVLACLSYYLSSELRLTPLIQLFLSSGWFIPASCEHMTSGACVNDVGAVTLDL